MGFSAKINYRALLLALCTVIVTSSCTTSAPEIVELDISITNKSMTPNEISVKQNDTLVMNISSDEDGSIHIHGYDIEKKVSKNVKQQLKLDTYATGMYNIAFHIGTGTHSHEGHDHSEECMAKLPEGSKTPEINVIVKPSEKDEGHIDIQIETDNIQFSPTGNHWHLILDGVLFGMYSDTSITIDSKTIGTLEEIKEKQAIKITINDSQHCAYMDIHPSIKYTSSMNDMHEHHDASETIHTDDHHKDEIEEVIIGSLRVNPG